MDTSASAPNPELMYYNLSCHCRHLWDLMHTHIVVANKKGRHFKPAFLYYLKKEDISNLVLSITQDQSGTLHSSPQG